MCRLMQTTANVLSSPDRPGAVWDLGADDTVDGLGRRWSAASPGFAGAASAAGIWARVSPMSLPRARLRLTGR